MVIYVTLRPMYKKCPRCGKPYSWNPDVGKMSCPKCGLISPGMGDVTGTKTILDIFKKK